MGWMDGWMDGWAADGRTEIDFKVIIGTAIISLCAGGTQS